MKTRIKQCNIQYETWQMQCCGEPIQVGQVVNLHCIKERPYTSSCGINVDYGEDHHHNSANCLVRGTVTRIRSVFVDRFANESTHYNEDPNNTLTVIDVLSIDGRETPSCYNHRTDGDVSFYIITLENAIECVLESSVQGLFVMMMEPDDDSKTIFWNKEGSPKIMQYRIDEGLFVQNAYVDMEYNDDDNCNYLFKLNGLEHDFHPDDRVMLGVNGRPHYQTGTVIRCIDDGLLIHTDWTLDISESYSIELIV